MDSSASNSASPRNSITTLGAQNAKNLNLMCPPSIKPDSISKFKVYGAGLLSCVSELQHVIEDALDLGRIEIKGGAGYIERVYFEITESNIEQWNKPHIKVGLF